MDNYIYVFYVNNIYIRLGDAFVFIKIDNAGKLLPEESYIKVNLIFKD